MHFHPRRSTSGCNITQLDEECACLEKELYLLAGRDRARSLAHLSTRVHNAVCLVPDECPIRSLGERGVRSQLGKALLEIVVLNFELG